jgi:hypothetical protein
MQTYANEELPPDIRQRVSDDFGAEAADEVYSYLLQRIPDGLPNGTRPRHLRCILYLAGGDREKLDYYIKMCLEDTRDVMLNAEYAHPASANPRRVRNFAKPFGEAKRS